MTGFWGGVLACIIVLITVPIILAMCGLLLTFAFDHLRLLKPLPLVPKTRERRARLAAMLFCSERVARILWVAGFGIIVYRQNAHVINDRQHRVYSAIVSADLKADQ